MLSPGLYLSRDKAPSFFLTVFEVITSADVAFVVANLHARQRGKSSLFKFAVDLCLVGITVRLKITLPSWSLTF